MKPTHKCKACILSMRWALENHRTNMAAMACALIVDKETHFHIKAVR